MTTPFPGMDPYLERPDLWPDVHNSLVAGVRDRLAPLLRPRYAVRLEERIYETDGGGLEFVGRPDASVHEPVAAYGGRLPPVAVIVPLPDRVRETYIVLRSPGRDEVVTVLELLSPSNKRPGKGRDLYLEKRMAILGSRTHLVEVDLVRAGDPMPLDGKAPASAYRILVSRGDRRPAADLYPFGVRDPIPAFPLPLRRGDEEPDVDVGAVLRDLYDRAAYDLSVDYRADPDPPLEARDRKWADRLLRRARRRGSA